MAEIFVNKELDEAKKVLVVGLTNIDVINACDHFPKEDEDMRVLSQRWAIGGNAANTARILAQHKNLKVDLFSGLSRKNEISFVIKELENAGVNLEFCDFYEDNLPMSSCILNTQNGSRTILSCNNNFPTLNFQSFSSRVDINTYDLIHFEGRDLHDVGKMIDFIISNRTDINKPIISGEMEKPKRLAALEEQLQPKPDILFVNKDIARSKGFTTSMETVKGLSAMKLNAKYIVCTWGEKGASVGEFLSDSKTWRYNHVPAFELTKPVDTLGAGDTFLAGVIFGLLADNSIDKAVKYGCYIAKKKCEKVGFQNIL